MITTQTLQDAANELFENISIEYVDDGDTFHWNINSPDPEESDEDITVAKVYIEDGACTLNICCLNDYDIMITNDPRYLNDARNVLLYIVEIIRAEISEHVNYYDVLLDYFD